MQKQSSSNRRDSNHRAHEKGGGSSRSRTTSSHPATGFYSDSTDASSTPFTYSSSSHSYSKKIVKEEDGKRSETEEYSSTDEYHVDFPPVELKLPRHRRNRQRPEANEGLDRQAVYEDLSSRSGASGHFSSPATDSTMYETYSSQQRFQSIGNIFSSIIGFFQNNPNMTKFLLAIALCYVVVCNLEILIPKLISMIVRLLYPWARFWTVATEQFFSAIVNIVTRMDAVIHASYCEFAARYCRSRRLMCDVTCSFVDHVLSQSRPHLAPIPQN